ncbi:MAG: hypothetical protein Q7K28_02470 [Candidatus Wildermuthbacteria bacterium]|nr:hypothetical protein [Candidatus Wildermuthbacteria bacterium]
MIKNNHIEEARKSLGFLRRGTKAYDISLRCLREELKNGSLSLADIGTNEKELEGLRIEGCKLVAKAWLDRLHELRGSTEFYTYGRQLLEYLRQEVKKGSFPLADIGTSEEELLNFDLAIA